MDKTWSTLISILDKWERKGNVIPALNMNIEIIDHGLAQGFLKKEGEEAEKESDEGCLFRAHSASRVLQMTQGEDTGSVLNMTREQHLELIRRVSNMADKLKAGIEKSLSIAPETRLSRTIH